MNLVIGEVFQALVLCELLCLCSMLHHLLTSIAKVNNLLFSVEFQLERCQVRLDLKVSRLFKFLSRPILRIQVSSLNLVEGLLVHFLFGPFDNIFEVDGCLFHMLRLPLLD